MLSGLTRHTGQAMTVRASSVWHWHGQPVRLVAGTMVTMPDTLANPALYPQPRSQEPGPGFPLVRLVALSCPGSGSALDAAIGGHRGKGSDEQTLLRTLPDTLASGDLSLGDAYFARHCLLCALRGRHVQAVFQQQDARRCSADVRRGKRLGMRDHRIELRKPKTQTRVDGAGAVRTGA
jgi:hypothetical protein